MERGNSDLEIETKEKPEWKEYTVGVMGASSNKNTEAMTNGYEVGKMLGERGYDVANGGYAVGGMGETARGFQDICKKKNIAEDEAGEHFQAVVLSEEAIGKKLAEKRTYIKPASVHEYDNFTSRSGGIINRSDAVIALPGGIGTITESYASAMGEWFRQLKAKDGEGRPYIRPLIVIDSKNTLVKQAALAEAESPGTINTISDDTFVLAGHKLENGDIATLANDPQMKKELEMILEYYQLIKKGKNAIEGSSKDKERVEEIQEYINKDMNRFVSLKDIVEEKKDTFKQLGDDWGTK